MIKLWRIWRIWRCRKVLLKRFRCILDIMERTPMNNHSIREDRIHWRTAKETIDYIDGKCDREGFYHDNN